MSRRQFISASALAVAAPAVLRSRAFASVLQGPVTRFEGLQGGVGYFIGNGGTIGWLLNGDGALAIDSQYPATAQVCVDGLRGRSPKGVRLLINTHHHADHVAGNPRFRPYVETIVQQERCAKLHRDTTVKTAASQAYADLTFGGSWSTTFGNEKVWAKYYGPGHTGGDAIVIFEKANVVHMGDLMFNRMHPFIDRPNGASIQNWVKALGTIAGEYKDATFIFGHAKPGMPVVGSNADLLHFRDYLSAVLDQARKGIAAKQTKAQITALPSLPGFEEYSGAPPRLTLASSLGVAYDELMGK